MSEQQAKPARPPQVTVACAIVMVGSIFVVLLVWDRIAGLHTLETQQALQTFLNRSDLKQAGIGLAALGTIVKVVSMASAACAVAMVVLGWQVAQRSHSARLALTILAVPLFLTGLVGDGFVSSAAATFWCSGVAAAVLTLWLGPTRVWFGDAGVAPRDAASALARPPVLGSRPPTPTLPAEPPAAGPPPAAPWVAPPPTGPGSAPGWTLPPVSTYDARRGVGARPRALLAGCLITWVCTALATIGLVLSITMLAGDSDSMLDQMYRQNPDLADQGVGRHTMLVLLIVISVVVLIATIAAGVFAVLLFLGRSWAWYALIVASSAAAILFLVAAVGSAVALVPLAAAVATIACLVRPEVRAWLLRR